jgi:hypothetical protein
MTLGAFDLFEGLDIFMLRAVHNGKNLGDEMSFISGPVAARASIKWLQNLSLACVFFRAFIGYKGSARTRKTLCLIKIRFSR